MQKLWKGAQPVKQLHIIQYRKIKNVDLKFSNTLNGISGTNGTCKSSLLHIISNSFQRVPSNAEWLNDNACIGTLKSVNSILNPKVESLTRGDKTYNDPAHGVNGSLFSADYYDHTTLNFRRHNSNKNGRYAIKPAYAKGSHDSLPACPVVYLGIPRLVPYGEYNNDDAIQRIRKSLPEEYWNEVIEQYKNFTHYDISSISVQQMGDIKTRAEFSSDKEGIDSNTISAGEDNLFIILTALVSLKYYFKSIVSSKTVESILLIDELDATLHPAFQLKLLELFRDFSEHYKIQIIFTTHSMSLLEDMLNKGDNVLYLVDNITDVILMEDPDIYKIKMHLSSLTHQDIYLDKKIPIFTEDEEARTIIDALLDHFEETRPEFRGCKRFFYMPNVNFGGDNLAKMFKDSKLLRMTMRSICILDGDKNTDLTSGILTLPGRNPSKEGSANLSPEKLLFEYAALLYDTDDMFWKDSIVVGKGYSKNIYIERISSRISSFQKEVSEGTAHQKEREFNKNLFNQEAEFFSMLLKHWINNDANKAEIEKFYGNLKILFRRMAQLNDINPNEWK